MQTARDDNAGAALGMTASGLRLGMTTRELARNDSEGPAARDDKSIYRLIENESFR